MMGETELFKMYQAWMQGNDHYVRDWSYFVEYAAKWNQTTGDVVMKQLQKYYWFKTE
jgi:hypothetical protein